MANPNGKNGIGGKAIHRINASAAAAVEQAAPVEMRQARGMHESDVQHCGFLLWAMQEPRRRNRNHVARLTARSKNTVTQWYSRYRWVERAGFPDAEHWAGRLLHALYPRMLAEAMHALPELKRLQELVEQGAYTSENLVELPQASGPDGDVDGDVGGKTTAASPSGPLPSASEVAKTLPERGTPELRAVKTVSRAIVTQIGKKVLDKEYDLHIRDFFAAGKILLALEGLPSEVIGHVGGAGAIESVRVRQAKEGGGTPADILRARREDLTETLFAIDQTLLQEEITAAEEAGHVIAFPTEPG